MDTKKLSFLAFVVILAGSIAALTVNQEVIVTVVPGIINVHSPVQGGIYDNRMVLLNISMTSEADILYARDGDKLIKICRNCIEYSKEKPFDNGFHMLTIEGEFEGGTVFTQVNFTVDSKKPNIKKTSPNKGYADGDFHVEFDETNPVQLILHYGEDTKEVDIGESCYLSDGMHYCDTEVDLSSYDGQEIEYWWVLTDVIGREDKSKTREVKVDLTDPILTVNMPEDDGIYGNKVPFNLSASEEVTLAYIDNGPDWKDFCENCDSYGVNKLKTRGFKEGPHEITIRATDKAGNFDEETLSFFVF